MDFVGWYEDNQMEIMMRFGLHSHSGITPNEVLDHFVKKELFNEKPYEKEVLGE